jgi:carboxyl-terminal processing protease
MKTKLKQGMKLTSAAIAAALALAFAPQAGAQEAAAGAGRTTVVLPEAEMQKLVAAYALIKQNYVGQTDDKKLFDGALSGMLASLDAHSNYMDEEAMRELDRSSSGEYVGIGIEVEADHDRLAVIATTEGSPAERAGIAAGDVIVAIDGVALAGLPENDLSRRLAGAPGSVATLDVLSHGKLRTVRVTRAPLHDTTVRLRMAARGVAWIRISEFGGATGADLARVLKQLDGKTPPRGLILDLRNDPGGLVGAGVAVAGAFLPPGAVVFSARGREADAQTTVTVDPRYYRLPDEDDVLASLPAWTRSVPLTVLVNGASASAAELVAGALQDNRRAIVIGSRTFGKGSIQSVIPLTADSGIRFTVARYFTPNGHEIQAHGVTPDIVVAPAVSADGDLLLRETDLANHLPATQQEANASEHAPVEPARMFGTRGDKALRTAVAQLKPADGHAPILTGLLRKLGLAPGKASQATGTGSLAPAALRDAR